MGTNNGNDQDKKRTPKTVKKQIVLPSSVQRSKKQSSQPSSRRSSGSKNSNSLSSNHNSGSNYNAKPSNKGTVHKAGFVDNLNGYYRKAVKKYRKLPPNKRILLLIGLAVAIVIIVVSAFIVFGKNSYEVYIGDTNLGYIAYDRKLTPQSFQDAVEAELKVEYGTDVKLNEQVSLDSHRVSKSKIVSEDTMIKNIKDSGNFTINATTISVNGEDQVIVGNDSDAGQVMDQILGQYVDDGAQIEKQSFVDDVQTSQSFVSPDQISTVDQAFAKLNGIREATETYTIQAGDTLWSIEAYTGMSQDELFAANPNLAENSVLTIGDNLNVTVTSPMVSVNTIEDITDTNTGNVTRVTKINDKTVSETAMGTSAKTTNDGANNNSTGTNNQSSAEAQSGANSNSATPSGSNSTEASSNTEAPSNSPAPSGNTSSPTSSNPPQSTQKAGSTNK